MLQCRGAPLNKYSGVRFAESVRAFCRLLIVSLETALERKSRQEYHFVFCFFVWGLVIYYVFSGGVEPSGILSFSVCGIICFFVDISRFSNYTVHSSV